jgi:hypothetical protein
MKGLSIVHGDNGCPLSKSILCRRCHNKGHMTMHCSDRWSHWERPTTLEELIPVDVRMRYGIQTHTRLEFDKPRGADGTEKELHSCAEIIIPEDYSDLKEFVERHKISVEKKTKESRMACIKAIQEWGVSHGYRIVMQLEPAQVITAA